MRKRSLAGIFTCGIWDVLAYSSWTSMAMAKRVWQLDSSRRIRLKLTLTDFLIVGKVHYSRRTIAAEILSRFYLYFTNQNNDGQTKTSARFSVSKRSRNHLDKCFNCSFELVYWGEEDVRRNFWTLEIVGISRTFDEASRGFNHHQSSSHKFSSNRGTL